MLQNGLNAGLYGISKVKLRKLNVRKRSKNKPANSPAEANIPADNPAKTPAIFLK